MKTKQELFEEIEKLKEVNLIDFVCLTHGFRLDEERTSKENADSRNPRYVFVENEIGDKLLISRVVQDGKQQYLYKNIYNDLDRGNIFSFIKYRSEAFSIPMAKKKIYGFVENLEKGHFSSVGVSIELKSDEDKKNTDRTIAEVQRKYQVLPEFYHQEYLGSRGLSMEILNSHLCKNRIKNEIIYGPKISSTHKPPVKYINTVFPLFASDGNKTFICGYVRKNENLKVTATDSFQSIGIWSSDYKRNEPVTHLIISENPIDSLSYVQLKKMDLATCNPVLVASNGELSKTHIDLYQEIITRLEPKEIVLANDNNSKGQQFNAKILSRIALPDEYMDELYKKNNKLIVDCDIHAGYKDRQHGEVIWKFQHNKILDNLGREEYLLEHIPQFQRVCNEYERLNKELYLVNDEKYPFTIERTFNKYESVVKISFVNTVDNWKSINESLMTLKFDHSEHIRLEASKGVDWNDDLKEQLGLEKIQAIREKI
ncbi:MAG: toprim domain-containing protein [Bacteroidetes bacterium]|nr:toprim domain-containing protein [Bacteroidota bacterium]